MKKKLLFILVIMFTFSVGSACFGGCDSKSSPSSSSSDSIPVIDKKVEKTKLVTYEGPSLLESSSKVNIEVEGQELFVYETRVNYARVFTFSYPSTTVPVAIFDFEGKVEVKITFNEASNIDKAVVRPLHYNIESVIEGNSVKFELEYPDSYTIEYNDDFTTAVHLFANPLEEDAPDPENLDENTIYIGPGIYNTGAIPVKSNTTIYLSGGAYVYGQIRGEGLNNVTIKGRGIISGSIFDRTAENQFTIPIEFRSSSNITIEGITILDPAGWTVAIYKCNNVNINNLKIITARANGDGVSVQSSSEVTMKDGFVRAWDDALVVKNVDRGNTNNVLFDDVTIWTDLAQSMEVGYETYGAKMENITFRNITVLHNFHKAAMSIHNSDDAVISNVLFQNITIEDAKMLGDDQNDGLNDFLFDLTVAYSIEWTKSQGVRGKISNVTFENIKVLDIADTIISRINGESNESDISNITFKNVKIVDKPIKSESDLRLAKNQYAKQIKFEYDEKAVSGAKVNLPYILDLKDDTPIITNKESIEQSGLIVPDFAHLKGDLSYLGLKITGEFSVSATHGVGSSNSTPVDDGSGPNEVSGYPASNLIDGDVNTTYRSKSWTGEDKEFTGITIDFDETKYVGTIRIKGNKDNNFLYNCDIQVWGFKETGFRYVRVLSTRTYELSPQSGNVIDIKLTAEKFKGLQLRIFRLDGLMAMNYVEFSEIEFYPPSLSYNKPIVDASVHADVYTVSRITDGIIGGTSYYESLELPAYVVVDLLDVYDIEVIVMHLPPSLLWDTRVQEIAIYVSDDNVSWSNQDVTFNEVVELTPYTFDPTTGNMVSVNLEQAVKARYIKLYFKSNSIAGGYGAQISELNVYGS